MHLEKYPLAHLVPSPSPPGRSPAGLSSSGPTADLCSDPPRRNGHSSPVRVSDPGCEFDDPSADDGELQGRVFDDLDREPIRIGTGSISKRRAQIRYGCERALAFLGSVVSERGLQSELSEEPRAFRREAGRGTAEGPNGHPFRNGQSAAENRGDIGVADDLIGRSELYSTAAALAWLPTLPVALREPLVSWLRQHLDSRGRMSFFGGDGSGCVETTGTALLALWRVGALEGDLLRHGALSVLRSGTSTQAMGELEAGIFGSRWRRPPGSAAVVDPGVVVQALFPVLLALRTGRLTLVEPVDLGDDDGPFVVAEVVQQNLALLVRHLTSSAVDGGTERYPSPEVFLFMATELWRSTTPLSASLRTPLERVISARWAAVEQEGLGALRRAALLIAAENLHLGQVDLERGRLQLLLLQRDDGSFPSEPLMRFAEPSLSFGSRGLTTALALRALQGQPRSGAWRKV